ncbi:MAG: redoxin domain-containing protein [Bacteroidia bacterium]|nr:redoxin domain-containing protein [Bacteroidia bacterium]
MGSKYFKTLMKLFFTTILLTFCAILLAISLQGNYIPRPISQEKIEVVSFKDFEEIVLYNNNDTVYVINFWATWCKPCIAELPYFEELREKYSTQKLKVFLTSLDFPSKIQSQLIPFIKNREINSEVLLLDEADANAWIDKVSPKWSGAIPATLIYNTKNNFRQFYEKSFTFEELNEIVEPLIK